MTKSLPATDLKDLSDEEIVTLCNMLATQHDLLGMMADIANEASKRITKLTELVKRQRRGHST